MKRLVIMAAALGAVMVVAGSAGAQTATPPNSTMPTNVGPNFVDANGDGICDHRAGTRMSPRQMAGRGTGRFGPGSGAGNQGVGPRDGSGYRQGGGRGTCHGAGPRGRRGHRG